MKNKIILSGIMAAALVASGGGCASEKCERCETSDNHKEASLVAQARISKEAAQQTALAQVPGGTVKDGELEKEHGKLIWSFDITVADSQLIKEVAVDAITGDVLAVDTETPEQQAQEAAEDAARAKKPGEDKD